MDGKRCRRVPRFVCLVLAANFPGRSQIHRLGLGHGEFTVNDNDRVFRFVLRKKARKPKKSLPSLSILLADLNCPVYDIRCVCEFSLPLQITFRQIVFVGSTGVHRCNL